MISWRLLCAASNILLVCTMMKFSAHNRHRVGYQDGSGSIIKGKVLGLFRGGLIRYIYTCLPKASIIFPRFSSCCLFMNICGYTIPHPASYSILRQSMSSRTVQVILHLLQSFFCVHSCCAQVCTSLIHVQPQQYDMVSTACANNSVPTAV